MAKRKTKASASTKRKKFSLPRAFKLLPVTLKGRVKKHRHVVGAAAEAPCPPGWTFDSYITIGGHRYCIYRNEQGGILLVLC